MKKVVFIIESLVIFYLYSLCNPLFSNGTTTATIYLTSNKNIIEKTEEIEINFHIKDQKTAAYFANIYFDETKFEFVSGPENIKIDGNQVKILWYDEQGGSGAKQEKLGEMVFKAKEEGLANFVIDGEFYSEKGQLIQTNFENLQVKVGKEETNLEKQSKEEQGSSTQSNNDRLKSLRIDIEGMVPDFNSDVYDYDLNILNDINEIEVLAIAENSNSQVEITGNTDLIQGLNFIKIKVISEDKTQEKTYTIKVTKTVNLELANTNLEILAIENALLNPAFENHITQYNTDIANDITKLNIFAVPENEQGKVQIIGGNDLKEGNNSIIVTVTAPNGISKRDYKINVYKRNLEEEEKYKKELEEQKEKLQQAYEIEKLSYVNEENALSKSKNNYLLIGTISIILVTAIVIGVIYYKKRLLKRK